MRLIKWGITLLLMTLPFAFNGCSSDNNESSDCEIQEFKFQKLKNSNLALDCIGTIIGTNITVEVPAGTDVSGLVATFETTGSSVSVDNVTQTSGVTASNFTTPVVYTVVAEDRTTKNYTVSVVYPGKEITNFVFEASKNPQLVADVVGQITTSGTSKTITLELPDNVDRTALIATFVSTGVKVMVEGEEQTSGQTAVDFTENVTYTVTAENGTTANYTVIVTAKRLTSITSFTLKKENNSGVPVDLNFAIDENEKTITGYILKWIDTDNPDQFIATFTAPEGATVSINGTEQETGVTINSFKEALTYSVKHSESPVSTEYTVRLVCPQINATLPVMRFSIAVGDVPRKDLSYAQTKLEIQPNGVSGDIWTYDDGDVDIRLRGNSTQNLPKKPFRLRFPDKIKPLGTGEATERNWVLLANDADKTLVRNAVAFSISRTLLKSGDAFHNPNAVLFTAATQHVDVYLGDEYQGVYHLTDHMQRNPGRVDLQKPDASDPNELSGGYLVELDGFANSEFAWFKTPKDLPVTLKYPDMEDDHASQSDAFNDPRFIYIKGIFATAENSLFDGNYKDVDNGWRKYYDESTLVDYYIISEFTGNSDAWWSTYMYKLRDTDSRKLFFGPVWDFDIAFDNDDRLGNATGKLMLNNAHEPRTWMTRFFTDEKLKSAVKTRWNNKKAELLQNAITTIDKDTETIYMSRLANFEKWNITQQNLGHCKPGPANYESGIEQLKLYINNRYTYLDGVFNGW